MLWGQRVKVYTDHKNLMQKALGYTSDKVYHWILLLEEFRPKIVWIKGVHNTVADAISRLEYGPVKDINQNWMTFTKCWNFYSQEKTEESPDYVVSLNFVFANTQEEDSIYPLTITEIAEAQSEDADLKALAKADKYEKQLAEDTLVYCKDGKLVIPKPLQRRAVEWYHHYLQHPGSTRLEETLRGSMYWKGMQRTVRAYVKNCKKCQVNKRRQKQYGKLPPKQVITKPWHTLCVLLEGWSGQSEETRNYEFATRFRKLKFRFISKFLDFQVLRFRNWLEVSRPSLGLPLLAPVIAVKTIRCSFPTLSVII
jgi:hypothetical protein